jgi:hypothetical protein
MSDMSDTTLRDVETTGLYFHIGNSGFSFQVDDNGQGPELVIRGSVFGHQMLRAQMFTTREGIMALSGFLLRQSARRFSEPYCHATKAPEPLRGAPLPEGEPRTNDWYGIVLGRCQEMLLLAQKQLGETTFRWTLKELVRGCGYELGEKLSPDAPSHPIGTIPEKP